MHHYNRACMGVSLGDIRLAGRPGRPYHHQSTDSSPRTGSPCQGPPSFLVLLSDHGWQPVTDARSFRCFNGRDMDAAERCVCVIPWLRMEYRGALPHSVPFEDDRNAPQIKEDAVFRPTRISTGIYWYQTRHSCPRLPKRCALTGPG